MGPPQNLVYPKLPRSTVQRYNHQATYDLRTVQTIVNTSPVLHISFTPDPNEPFPAILPMIGQMGSFDHPSADESEPLDCYLHGYVSHRIMNLAREAQKDGGKGTPVCVAATKVDGYVLTLTPNTHTYNYRSAILHGYATLPPSEEEKLWAMELVTNSVIPGRWANSRTPPDKAELDSTRILKVVVEAGSGKVREGVPNDERKDLQREELLDTIWTGVIPRYEVFGEPIPGPYNRLKDVPEHVTSFVQAHNEAVEEYAVKAGSKPAPVKRGPNAKGAENNVDEA